MNKVEIPNVMYPSLRKLRVAAYCRVSKAQDEQFSSLQAQIEYFTEMIYNNPQWKSAGIYADKASGRNSQGMNQFNQMMESCRKNEIDFILTKSVSRFGRNTLEVLLLCEELKKLGIDVCFEIENLHLQSPQGILMLTVLASFAQEESESKSYNISWGLRRGFESGQSKLQNRRCYGYKRSETSELVIEPNEAKIVRQIFRWRSEGESLRSISANLKKRGVKSPRGRDVWGTEALNKLLANEKYTGSVLLQKTFVRDYFSGKQVKNTGQLAQYLVGNNHPAIIKPELFNDINRFR